MSGAVVKKKWKRAFWDESKLSAWLPNSADF